ncbi:MAG: ATP--guanido phosphotransferase [Phycisphaerae bacterium]|nr:ATP--guanido phosphotransferase [Phycisphaerae bacterium]
MNNADDPRESAHSGHDRPAIPYDRTEWLTGRGPTTDVVMSSRVRLARNLTESSFPVRIGSADATRVLDRVRPSVLAAGLADRVMWVELHTSSKLDRDLLVERHLISPQLASGKVGSRRATPSMPRAVAIGLPDERLSIMVNEEDHLRIQLIHSGLDLTGAMVAIDTIDDRLESSLDFAYHPRFGYLTSCPTNVGTGARLSVMLHLPALRMTGDLAKVKNATDDLGLALRGFHGEDSEGSGDFFQLSNQTTLGKSEQVLLHEMEQDIVPRVVEYERRSRQLLLDRRHDATTDEVWRAYGVLASARLLTASEAMKLLSRLRLGVLLGIIPGLSEQTVNLLMLLVQPAHLQSVVGSELSQRERRVKRADLVRTRLAAGAQPKASDA